MDMAGCSADQKNRVSEALDATYYKQRSFSLEYDEVKNPVAVITFTPRPEYRFVIESIGDGGFATSERPGTHSDSVETFQRSDFELCLSAIKNWAARIYERESDFLDEFGGVADRLPSY